ncbi:nSTAND1 domain-containing NTPase [Pseudonocardia sichuanensis]
MADEGSTHVVTAPGTVTSGRAIPALAATACVRVRDRRGDVVGSGFLVGPDLVATCAHVVATAAGTDAYGPAPDAPVAIDFPVLPGGPVPGWARVHRWLPIEEDGTGDVALLRLTAPAPPGAVMPPVRRFDRLWDRPFRVFGFPEGRWDGVWSTGRFRAGQGTGWLQLQGTPGDQPIEGGFSGAPVWDEASDAVVGMTVAADRDPGVTTAYLIPVAQVLGLDPELLPNPYRGLEPFGEEHAEYFFGREPEVRRLRAALDRHPLVAVAGPSGAGKSSLVRAGLLPRLRADGVAVADVRPLPGTPVLPTVVEAVLAPAGNRGDAQRIAAGLADPAGRAAAVAEIADAVSRAPVRRLVLVVDQFEELADADLDAGRELLDALAAVSAPSGDGDALRVVLTMRGTALDEVLTADAAEALGPGTVLVGPMDRARLREAVVRPAERAPGLAFEDGLVERILDDAGTEPGRLPLVESLLAQLWARREGGSLTVRGYEEAGGVAGAVAAHAEQVVAGVIAEGRLDELRALCTRLVLPAAEGRFVRRAAPFDELPPRLRALVPPLAAGRLLVAAGGRTGGSVELAHQSLIEHWPRLRGWLESDRAFLAWRSELDAARGRWAAGGHDDGALLRGGALDSAEGWLRERPGEVGTGEAEYVRRSRARQRREVRRWRLVAAVLGVLVLAAGTLSVVAVRRGNQVATQLATANAGNLAGQATARAGTDPVLAAELAAVAWNSDPESPAARTALADRHAALAGVDGVLTGGPGGPEQLGLRADGDTLLAGQDPRIDFVRDAAAPRPAPPWELPEPTGAAKVLPSPDGTRVGVLAGDGGLRLWTVGAPAPDLELAAPGGPQVLAMGFSPDGTRLGWLTRDRPGRATVHLRDLASGTTRAAPLALDTDDVRLRLTPDPGLVALRTGGGLEVSWTLHHVDGDAPDRTLPPTTTVQGGGSLTATCVDGPVDAGGDTQQAQLEVRDLVTGTERHRIELPTSSCALLWFSLDGRYAVDPFGSLADPPAVELVRITDLVTGVSYQAAAPPLDPTAWPTGEAPVVTALPDGHSGLVAFVAVGPTVLRIPAAREIRFDPDFGSTHYDAPGSVLVTRDSPAAGTSAFDAYDPATGDPIAALPAAVTDAGGWSVQDALVTFGRGPEGWQLDRYELPTLTRTFSARPPSDPAVTDRGVVVSDSGGEVVVALADGYLSAWDGRTGELLGQPRRLADPAADQAVVRMPRLWPRADRPGEAFVAGPAGLELWDARAGRLLATIETPLDLFTDVASAGDRLAIFREGAIEVWDIPTRARVGAIPAPDLARLTGFGTDGLLVSENVLRGEVVFWDLDRLAQAGSVRPSPDGLDRLDGETLEVNGVGGRMPLQLAATAEQWHSHLCRVLPAELSPAARALLPPGAEPSTGCT